MTKRPDLAHLTDHELDALEYLESRAHEPNTAPPPDKGSRDQLAAAFEAIAAFLRQAPDG